MPITYLTWIGKLADLAIVNQHIRPSAGGRLLASVCRCAAIGLIKSYIWLNLIRLLCPCLRPDPLSEATFSSLMTEARSRSAVDRFVATRASSGMTCPAKGLSAVGARGMSQRVDDMKRIIANQPGTIKG